MNIEFVVILMFASMILLLLTGRHIFVIVGAVATISALALWGTGAETMPFIGGYSVTMKWYPIYALPPFVFMGLTLARSGVADNLYQAIYLWVGRIRGGLAMGTVGVCSLVACMSGLSVAATTTAATIALPAMLKRKYDKLMVTGVVQAAGALGFLIPPSLVFIIYGMIARVSIGHLWVAGVMPGFLLAGMYIAYVGIRCRVQPHLGPAIPPETKITWGERISALRAGIAPIILIFIVLGLLFMGVTTIVECSAIGAVGAIACAAINRRLSWTLVRGVMDETLKISSMVLWIFAAGITFGAVFDGLGAVHAVERILFAVGGEPMTVISMMIATFIAMGMVLDDTAMLLIVAPLYIPVVQDMGFSLVWYGVLYVLTVQMAYLTPPFGYNLFIMKGIVGVKGIVPEGQKITIGDIYRSVIPFVCIQGACVGLVMVFPQIALWLPGVFFGG